MKGITLRQPYAALVMVGQKKIETRSWNTPYRGPLAIHAAKGPAWALDPVAERMMEEVRKELWRTACFSIADNLRGCIVARCTLADVVCIGPRGFLESSLFIAEHLWGDYRPGRFAWMLKDVRAITPIPYRGRLGLFDVPDELIPQVQETDPNED